MTVALLVGGTLAYALIWHGVMFAGMGEEEAATIPNEPCFIEKSVLPCSIQGTDLTALALVSYEGTFLEDGSDAEVSDISALLLRNDGKMLVRDAQIQILQENRILNFQLSNLPPASEILVLEKDQKIFTGSGIISCSGSVQYTNDNRWETRFSLETSDRRSLLVKNTTSTTIKNIKVHYKSYYEPCDFYIGGMTYSVQIDELGAGEEVLLLPFPYSSDGSKVVWISYAE